MVPAHQLEHLDDVQHPLDRTEVGDVGEHRGGAGGQPLAAVGHPLGGRRHEVGDDVDRPAHLEGPVGLLLQVLGHRGHGVALPDGQADHGQVAGIGTHDGDVGAVQGGDHLQAAAHRHAGQEGRGGVGDGVVGVHDVQAVVVGHVGHLGGQGDGVGGRLEQGVAAGGHLVEGDPVLEAHQPGRDGGAQEVHFMAPGGQRLAHFGGHHSRTAER